MRRVLGSLLLAALLTAGASSAAPAQGMAPASMAPMTTMAASAVTWADANVPGFAPGMKMAVINGNPEATEPYTLRLSFPDGYKFPPHWHPSAENVTVLSGTWVRPPMRRS